MSKYGKYSEKELVELLKLKDKDLKNKKLGLYWDRERDLEKVVLDCNTKLPILNKHESLNIKTKNDNSKPHILIEGDNYHALQVLNYTHKSKIDVIYIDPPYNTGKDCWIYNDKCVDSNDGFRHSKWLNMMEKRLELAKQLLSKKGVIFISIDDNEQAYLKLLCDKIFNNNFVGTFIWESRTTGGHDSEINKAHEYVHCFKKFEKNNAINKYKTGTEYREFDITKKRFFKWDSLWTVAHGTSKNCNYPIKAPDNSDVYPWMCHKDGIKVKGLARWYWSKETYDLKNKEDFLVKKQDNTWKVYKKVFSGSEVAHKSIFDKELVGGTSRGKKEVELIFNKIKVFDNPKSTALIKQILNISSKKDSIILDFFAGSGTTGHAVLKLNKEDGGNRQFILCTNNEFGKQEYKKLKNKYKVTTAKIEQERMKNSSMYKKWEKEYGVCSSVTYPRIEKIIKGYNFTGDSKKDLYRKELKNYTDIKDFDKENLEEIKNKNKERFEKVTIEFKNYVLKVIGINKIKDKMSGLGGNLEYFGTGFVENVSNITQLKYDLTQKCGQMLCLKESIFNKHESQNDFEIFISNDKKKFLCIYYNFINNSFSDFLKLLNNIKGFKVIYVFSEEDFIDENLFKDVKNKRIVPIPKRILEIYNKIARDIKKK